jgi:uncharacterized OB-fold protein
LSDKPWLDEIKALVGQHYGKVYAWDHVNTAMIRQWCEVMGITNPLYLDEDFAKASEFGAIVAPPAMLQAWCLEGLHMNNYPPGSTEQNPYEVLKKFESHGFESVVAVNSDLSFERYVHLDEKLYYTTRLDAVGDEKVTALGTGFFVTLVMSFYSEQSDGDDDYVGGLTFRVFKFNPHNKPEPQSADTPSTVPKILRSKPGISQDNAFFWEGVKEGELRIQQCNSCQQLQHPPGPVCQYCQHDELDYIVSCGEGKLYSFVVMHYPEVPPFEYPNPIGLVELKEGIRIVTGLTGFAKGELAIDAPVKVEFNEFDGDLTLPMFTKVDV